MRDDNRNRSLNAAEFKILCNSSLPEFINWNKNEYLKKDKKDIGIRCKKTFSFNSKDCKQKLLITI